MDNFFLILKTPTKINGLIQIYKKKSDEQNRFTYYATSPYLMSKCVLKESNKASYFVQKGGRSCSLLLILVDFVFI